MHKEPKRKIWAIYKITNSENGKIYIGQSVQPNKRWYQHRLAAARPKQVISYAIRKHGAHNFEFEIIDFAFTGWQAECLEDNWINQYDSRSPEKGYNMARGGMHYPKTDEWKDHISELMQGKHYSPETEFQHGHEPLPGSGKPKGYPAWCKGITGVASHSFGVVFTEERKQRIREKAIQNNFGDRLVKAGVETRFQPKLTDEQWEEIERLLFQGAKKTHVAKQFNVSPGAIIMHFKRLAS